MLIVDALFRTTEEIPASLFPRHNTLPPALLPLHQSENQIKWVDEIFAYPHAVVQPPTDFGQGDDRFSTQALCFDVVREP